MNDIDFIQTDVLVIGSGLAGLRSGISALEKKSGIKVLIASKGKGPSGSSFTNANNRLGIQVCFTDSEKEAFVSEALKIASPGIIQHELVSLMAGESDDCFRFLKNHRVKFLRDEKGLIKRVPGCFSPESNRAVVFTDLGRVYEHLNKKFISLSGNRIDNLTLIHLLNHTNSDGKSVCGGLFISKKTGRYCVINSRSTILATGGTIPLFLWHATGAHLSGYSPALLRNAGATIVNADFHQFIWHNAKTFEPVYPTSYLRNGYKIRNGNDFVTTIPDGIASELSGRDTHVPAAYGFSDIEVERFLLNCSDTNGVVTFVLPNQEEVSASLFAHAWNGGAQIDANGWTGVPGLFACGECASGMHGANRVGGAMVLATQVFGRRAGVQAVRRLTDIKPVERAACMDRAAEVVDDAKNASETHFDDAFKKQVYMDALYKLCEVRKKCDVPPTKEPGKMAHLADLERSLLNQSANIINDQ